MTDGQDRRYYFNSAYHQAPPADFPGEWIDLSRDLSVAHDLIRLGISPRSDLPAVTVEEAGGKLRVLGLRLTPEEALRLAAGDDPGVRLEQAATAPTVYGTGWCPDTRRAKRVLEEAGVDYDEVNLDEDPVAEALVLARSGGRRVTPALLFGDRVWLFHPDVRRLGAFVGAARPAARTAEGAADAPHDLRSA